MTDLVVNRRALFDYEILERLEAGIELLGFEVKAIRTGHVSLQGSFVTVRGHELWLTNADVPPYQVGNTPANYTSDRPRRLLLHREEIASLIGKIKHSGLTLIPLRLYSKKRQIKVELGLGRSKKKHDKRETIRRRDMAREVRRTLER
jgi:SsrA-binding protein